MCIAIAIPKGKANYLTDEIMENCYLVNQDGIGYVYTKPGGKRVHKVFMRYEKFLKQWHRDLKEIQNGACLLHFRATSKGETNVKNCHPFQVIDKQYFIHNGTIHGVKADPFKKKSDTRMFNEEILRQLPKGWAKSAAFKVLIEDFIGASKLAVLNEDDTFSFFNEKLGHWKDGIWWSNHHYTGTFYRNHNGFAQKETQVYNPPVRETHPAKDVPLAITHRATQQGIAEFVKEESTEKREPEFGTCQFCEQTYKLSLMMRVTFGFGADEKYLLCKDCIEETGHFGADDDDYDEDPAYCGA